MPQFDPTWFASQIFWLVLVFAALYWLMIKRAIPRVEKALTARSERIQGDLDRAAKLQQEAAAASEAHQAALAKAKDEARDILRAAHAASQAELDKRQEQLGAEIAKQTAAAESRIGAARDAAMASVRDIAIETAQAVTERLTGAAVEQAQAAKAVDAVLERRGH
jgi:F-type H+-transporting ATPase subunit b